MIKYKRSALIAVLMAIATLVAGILIRDSDFLATSENYLFGLGFVFGSIVYLCLKSTDYDSNSTLYAVWMTIFFPFIFQSFTRVIDYTIDSGGAIDGIYYTVLFTVSIASIPYVFLVTSITADASTNAGIPKRKSHKTRFRVGLYNLNRMLV